MNFKKLEVGKNGRDRAFNSVLMYIWNVTPLLGHFGGRVWRESRNL